MTSGFHSDYTLDDLAHWIEPAWPELSFLFVALDSSRQLETTVEHLGAILKKLGCTFQYGRGGLWVSARDFGNDPVRKQLLVPFTACYIFRGSFRDSAVPTFRRTTDTGEGFTPDDLAFVEVEAREISAAGFAADGCGLQYLVLEDSLGTLVDNGRRSQDRGNRNA